MTEPARKMDAAPSDSQEAPTLSQREAGLLAEYDRLAEQIAEEGKTESRTQRMALKGKLDSSPTSEAGLRLNAVQEELNQVRAEMAGASAAKEAPKLKSIEAGAEALTGKKMELDEQVEEVADDFKKTTSSWWQKTKSAFGHVKSWVRNEKAIRELDEHLASLKSGYQEKAKAAVAPTTPMAKVIDMQAYRDERDKEAASPDRPVVEKAKVEKPHVELTSAEREVLELRRKEARLSAEYDRLTQQIAEEGESEPRTQKWALEDKMNIGPTSEAGLRLNEVYEELEQVRAKLVKLGRPEEGTEENPIELTQAMKKPDEGTDENPILLTEEMKRPEEGTDENPIELTQEMRKPEEGTDENPVMLTEEMRKQEEGTEGNPILLTEEMRKPGGDTDDNYLEFLEPIGGFGENKAAEEVPAPEKPKPVGRKKAERAAKKPERTEAITTPEDIAAKIAKLRSKKAQSEAFIAELGTPRGIDDYVKDVYAYDAYHDRGEKGDKAAYVKSMVEDWKNGANEDLKKDVSDEVKAAIVKHRKKIEDADMEISKLEAALGGAASPSAEPEVKSEPAEPVIEETKAEAAAEEPKSAEVPPTVDTAAAESATAPEAKPEQKGSVLDRLEGKLQVIAAELKKTEAGKENVTFAAKIGNMKPDQLVDLLKVNKVISESEATELSGQFKVNSEAANRFRKQLAKAVRKGA